MPRPGVKTFGRDGINYDKNATDSRIKSFWVSGEHGGKKSHDGSVHPSEDVRRICGPLAGHVPVLCNPSVEAAYPLNGDPNGVYADCTFGRGGHSAALLARLGEKGSLYSFDVDPSAVAVGRQLEQKDPRFHMVHRPFSSLAEAIPAGLELSGVLMDLGFSSPQMDQRFHEGPLDLRYNPLQGQPASKWMTALDSAELAWLFRQHGEDEDVMLCARLGEAIHQHHLVHGEFRSSAQIEEIITQVKKGLDDRRQLPSKLTIQSIRTWMNQEFFEFEKVLEGTFQRLKYGGRCAVICFKRQETLTLTKFISAHEEPDPDLVEGWPREKIIECYPLLKSDKKFAVRMISAPIAPTEAELFYNNRARSARTHVLEKRRRRVRWSLPSEPKHRELFRRPPVERAPVFGGSGPAPAVPYPPQDMPPEEIYCQYTAVAQASQSRDRSADRSRSSSAAPQRRERSADSRSSACPRDRGAESSERGVADQTAEATPALVRSVEDWLRSLDNGAGALLVYQQALQAEFGSFEELAARYKSPDGGFDVLRFCKEHGVRKAAHRRFLELWAKKVPA